MRKISIAFFTVLLAIFAEPLSASIIRKPPVKSVDTSYSDLVCTEQDRANIYEIISNMGEKSVIALGFHATYLRELGAQITHVHPLKFIGEIFKEPYLKSCMTIVWSSSWKRNGFMKDLAPALEREAEKGKLEYLLNDFAADVNANPAELKPYIDARDWNNFIVFLINN